MGAPGSWSWRGNVFKNSVMFGLDADLDTYSSPVVDIGNNPTQPPVGNYYSYQGK